MNANSTPLVTKTAFACPHCGAYTSQTWLRLFANALREGNKPDKPHIPDESVKQRIASDPDIPNEARPKLIKWVDRMMDGRPFLEEARDRVFVEESVQNLYLSQCYVCHDLSVWVHERLAWPASARTVPLPNTDLPDSIKRDYEEAARIINDSPRGAAALLRLCVQKLCEFLGERGDINDAIAALVKKGLSPAVQQSLDAVRVVGNEAVHGGLLDDRDMQGTAVQLFHLVNLIANAMISHPKQAAAVYAQLPTKKLEAIQKRDANGSE